MCCPLCQVFGVYNSDTEGPALVLLSARASASVQAFDCVRLSEDLVLPSRQADAGEHRSELEACLSAVLQYAVRCVK